MYMQNVTHAAIVAGAMTLAAVAGVMFVKMTSSGLGPQFQTAAAAIEPMQITQPAQPTLASISVSLVPPYFRNCLGALTEAKAAGVLPSFVALDAASPRRGRPGENICSAATQNVHYDIVYFSGCDGGGDFCPVLARVTRDGKYVDFQRD